MPKPIIVAEAALAIALPPPERPVGAWPKAPAAPLTHNDAIEAGRVAYIAGVEAAFDTIRLSHRLGFAALEAWMRRTSRIRAQAFQSADEGVAGD